MLPTTVYNRIDDEIKIFEVTLKAVSLHVTVLIEYSSRLLG